MYYEINVSKNGRHYFVTHERSLTDQGKAAELFTDFCVRFPKREGFEISVTYYPGTGQLFLTTKD